MGIPFDALLINFVGNAGEALVGALVIDHFLSRQERLDRLQAVALIMFFGGVVAPALMSFVVAQLFVQTGSTVDPWVNWQLRLLTNALAVFTLVPPIVLNLRKAPPPATPLAARRAGEAGALLVGLAISGALLFALPTAGSGHSQLLLYAPFPFLLWAAMRFGVVGICLSVLTLAAVSIWNAVNGHGPFAAQDPVGNATSLVLFLNVTCVPLLMLAALLEDRESEDVERRSAATLHSAVLASMHDQIAVLDREGVVREVNESWTAAGRPDPGVDYLGGLRSRVASAPDESAVRKLAGLEAVLRGDRARFQMELRRSPASNGWVEMSAEGLRRPEGGAVIAYTDITARKQVEDEMRLQRQELAHLTRVAMLGELSGALAHELNQPLTAILSNAQAGQRLMAKRPVDLAEVRAILDDIADDDRRAGEVIQRLRAMLKKGETKMVPLDLNELAREVLASRAQRPDHAQRQGGDRARSRAAAGGRRPRAAAAGAAQPGPQRLRGDERQPARRTHADHRHRPRRRERGEGRRGRPRHRHRRRRDRAALRALLHHQGARARPGPGDLPLDRRGARRTPVGEQQRGTRGHVLPDHAGARRRRLPGPFLSASGERPAWRETKVQFLPLAASAHGRVTMSDRRLLVAIVDDEEPVRRALRRLFLSAGIDVETFASGFELLDSAVTRRADCVVLDLHLPGLTGFDVMEQLTERAVDVPTVIVTGHNQPGTAERALAARCLCLPGETARRSAPARHRLFGGAQPRSPPAAAGGPPRPVLSLGASPPKVQLPAGGGRFILLGQGQLTTLPLRAARRVGGGRQSRKDRWNRTSVISLPISAASRL